MVFTLFFFIANLFAIEPTGYERKPDLKASAEVVGSQIVFQYGFKDPRGVYKEWSWQDDYTKLRELSDKFGVRGTSDLSTGLFVRHPLVGIIPDYNRIVSLYQSTVIEIYRHWKKAVDSEQLNRRESIELLLRFFQDYPYGMPPASIGGKFIGGLLVPPMSLETGWADCDSKSILMATILSFDPYFRDKMAMILVPGHALLGIEVVTMPYDETYEYRNRTFVSAEPTGLSRTPFGRRNSPYSKLLAIIPLTASGSEIQVSENQSGLQAISESDCPDEGFLLDYVSPSDKTRVQGCFIKIGEDLVKHGPLLKYDASGNPKEKEVFNRGVKSL